MPHRLILPLLRCPAATGAIVPSSPRLAAAMAAEAVSAHQVIELGAGTGPVTQALLARHLAEDLVVVELQPQLVTHLRKRFPNADVREACAHDVLDAYVAPTGRPTAIVSSLPFRSLPAAVRTQTIESILAFMERQPDSYLVQFTYQPRAPFAAPAGFRWRHAKSVWLNAPPAGVWVLRKTA